MAEVKLPCQADTHSLEAASFQGLVDAGYESLALLPTFGPLDLVLPLDLPAGPSNAFEGYLPGLPVLYHCPILLLSSLTALVPQGNPL